MKTMTSDGKALIMVVNNTDARITTEMHCYLCDFARGKPLPRAYFDCFDVTLVQVGEQTRIIVNWASVCRG